MEIERQKLINGGKKKMRRMKLGKENFENKFR
jgi:hypothetical protein